MDNRFGPIEVNLKPAPEGSEDNCGTCVFFRYQTSDCQIVEGPVSASQICDEHTGRPTIEQVVAIVQGKPEKELPKEPGNPWETDAKMTPNQLREYAQTLRSLDRVSLVKMHERQHAHADFNPDADSHRMLVSELRRRRRETFKNP